MYAILGDLSLTALLRPGNLRQEMHTRNNGRIRVEKYEDGRFGGDEGDREVTKRLRLTTRKNSSGHATLHLSEGYSKQSCVI
jgi:hypothetical protein